MKFDELNWICYDKMIKNQQISKDIFDQSCGEAQPSPFRLIF